MNYDPWQYLDEYYAHEDMLERQETEKQREAEYSQFVKFYSRDKEDV